MSSRFSRIEEQRTKKRLTLVILSTIIILVALITLGIPLLVRVSAFLGNSAGTTSIDDKTPPFAPRLSPVNSATNSAQLKVEGYAEPETTLEVIRNGDKVKEILLGRDGSFLITDISLDDGVNTIHAIATDKAGNESTLSNKLVITYKKKGPKLEIFSPEDGKTFGKNDQEITVSGSTEKQSSVWINDRFVSVADDGKFEYKLRISDGENIIKIVSQDTASNQTTIERKVTYSP